MARGNDSAAAAEELKAKLGTSPNAEEMIQLSNERWSGELRAANMRPLDQDATDELDEEKAQSFVGDRNVLAYAVRGPFLVVVSEDDTGFTVKQAFALDEKKAQRFLPKESKDEDDSDEKDAEKSEDKPAPAARQSAAAQK